MTARTPVTTRYWLSKSLAGLVLGLTIAIGISALFAWHGPGGLMAGTGKTQFSMWLVAPIWSLVLSLVFLFPTARAAWAWLGGAALLLAAAAALGRLLVTGSPA